MIMANVNQVSKDHLLAGLRLDGSVQYFTERVGLGAILDNCGTRFRILSEEEVRLYLAHDMFHELKACLKNKEDPNEYFIGPDLEWFEMTSLSKNPSLDEIKAAAGDYSNYIFEGGLVYLNIVLTPKGAGIKEVELRENVYYYIVPVDA